LTSRDDKQPEDADADEDPDAKRRRILAESRAIDADDDSDDASGSGSGNDDADDSDEDSSDDDDDAELQRELERVRRERIEKREAEERARLAAEQEARERDIALGNPLLNNAAAASAGGKAADFSIKRRWDDDVVFKNQARGTEEKGKRTEFINVSLLPVSDLCLGWVVERVESANGVLGPVAVGFPQEVYEQVCAVSSFGGGDISETGRVGVRVYFYIAA
jgi:hypothetical protein